jgi:D-alanyl-D-alanine carboxypeptidase
VSLVGRAHRAAVFALAATMGCAETTPDAPAPPEAETIEELEAEPIEPLRPDLAPIVATHVEHFGHNWPSFRFHGAVLVAREGDIAMLQGFGYARLTEGVPNTPHTRFRLGTLGAPITAAMVLVLADTERLALGDPISKYLPDVPGGDEITIEHLLAHRSGIECFTHTVGFQTWKRSGHTIDQTMQLVPPGGSGPSDIEITPSNSNYLLLGAIIERVTGEPFGDAARRLVLQPAGMLATSYGDGDTAPALGMQWNEDEAIDVVGEVDPTAYGSAGGFVSTVEDLHRFLHAISSGALLSVDARAQLFGRTPDDPGFGFVPNIEGGRRVVRWAGGIDGSAGAIEHVPADATTIVVLANGEVVPPVTIVEAIDAVIAGQEPPAWEEPRAAPIALADQLPAVGDYVITERSLSQLEQWADPEQLEQLMRIRIVQRGEYLLLDVPGHARRRMHPLTARRFFFKDVGRTTAEIAHTADGTRRLGLRKGDGPSAMEIRFVSLPPAGAHG